MHPRRDLPAPCCCGHDHVGKDCAECECASYCPDYVAQAERSGITVTPQLRVYQRDILLASGWAPPNPGRFARCAYCEGRFWARKGAETCSSTCRKARSRALAAGVVNILPASARRDTVSPERKAATGSGLMTASQSYAADMRVLEASDASA